MFKTKEWLEEGDDHSFYLIGDSDRTKYYCAIIGIAKDYSHVAYSYDKLVEKFAVENDWSYDEAIEWVDYNVIRALPYYGEKAPVVLYTSRVNENNKTYIPLKIA